MMCGETAAPSRVTPIPAGVPMQTASASGSTGGFARRTAALMSTSSTVAGYQCIAGRCSGTCGPATTEADVLGEARARARLAARRGFATEPNADWLLRRAVAAALRTIMRSRHPAAQRMAVNWVPKGIQDCSLPLGRLTTDRRVELMLHGETWAAIEDWFDVVLPLPDEQEASRLWRMLGISIAVVLEGTTLRGDSVMVSRITLDVRDRWFFYWSGSYQEGIYDLGRPLAGDRRTRRQELLGWVQALPDEFGELERLDVDCERRTFEDAAQLLAERSPDTEVVRRRIC